ncbi:spore germination protein GerXA [Bacillus anthracis]|uniref:spore germination protein GerXA n=1 Tax=Bacillus anthracis TaxID=1392 RepID=UPI00115212DC|nr:spore germination protein GerXA [Bacillus anthracis]BBK99527.1 spore germination protein XA [Bacillus anthracis]
MKRTVEVNESILRVWFEGCKDVKIMNRKWCADTTTTTILLVYCQHVIDHTKLKQAIAPEMCNDLLQSSFKDSNLLASNSQFSVTTLELENSNENVSRMLFEGKLLIIFQEYKRGYTIDIAKLPTRSIEQSNTEMTIRGSRDGFVEELSTNIGLIRKRLKTSSLSYDEFIIGERTQTKVGLLYLKDVASQETISQVQFKLKEINIDGVVSSAQIEEFITGDQFSLFPLIEYTGRPDYAVNCLLHGRFILLVDGSPTATIAPVSFPFFVNTAEDQNYFYLFGSFVRLLSLFGIAISIFLPGFWVALVTYHPDQIPYTLLATLSLSREGIPFPAPLEGMIMITLFELLRQAAISSGFVSPSMVVMIAISVVSTFTLVNQSFTGTLSILRYGVFLMSSFLGIVGFICSILLIVIHVANLRSFGLPFLAPYSPPVFSSMLPSTFRIPFTRMKKRPKELHTYDNTRQRTNNDENK